MIKRRANRVMGILRCYLGVKDLKGISSDLLWNEDEFGPLRSNEEVDSAVSYLQAMGLAVGHNRAKAWDLHKIFSYIVRNIPTDSPILDAGCGRLGGYLLYNLKKYGYKELYGCDLLSYNLSLGAVKLSRQDITATTFPDNKFACVSSISVIEHGVDIHRFFKEMYRILKSGGTLLLSTDYWCEAFDTEGTFPYGREGGQMKVFTPSDIQQIQQVANEAGFVAMGKITLDCGEPIVEWQGKKFTFILCGWTKGKH